MKKQYTLCLIQQGDDVLLGFKKRGFGQGRWNGFGGKVEEGETVDAAAVREVNEEVGLRVAKLDLRGILAFLFEGKKDSLEVHIFRAVEWNGIPAETAEMRPQWFANHAIPYDRMWPDDRHWLPLFLAGKRFRGTFHFDADGNVVQRMDLREVKTLP
ncbi:MAG: 8-oxo-dGTP diphosphatase [bacterium]|nr:8-oxo-dGTP diphosphatase [bacterium]